MKMPMSGLDRVWPRELMLSIELESWYYRKLCSRHIVIPRSQEFVFSRIKALSIYPHFLSYYYMPNNVVNIFLLTKSSPNLHAVV